MAAVRHLAFAAGALEPSTKSLVVFVVVQDLVGIDSAVSIICKFQYFASLA